jgi:AcrR family transcriptional regulator
MTKRAPQPYGRSLLRQERSHNTRRAILRAATSLWADHDFDSTTVEEICAAAGVGRSTYYLYFESKEGLLIELARATATGVSSDVDEWVEAGSVDDAVRVFVEGLVRRMESIPRGVAAIVMRRVAVANVSPRPVPGDPILFDDILTGIVRDGQRRGELRADLDPRDVGEVLGGATLDALQRWAGGDERRTLHASLYLRLGLVLDNIRAPASARAGG